MSAKKLLLNGKERSKVIRDAFPNEQISETTTLGRLLGAVYNDFIGAPKNKADSQRRFDFIFHMLDWARDARQFVDLLDHPEKYDKKTAEQFLIGFLFHVIPHLNAAGRLLLDEISDPFSPNKKKT